MNFDQSVIIVTGAGSGIGRAIARELARHGARIICVGRRLDRLEQTVAEITTADGEAVAIATDITDDQAVKWMADQAVERFGRIDVLVNNAGSFQCLGAVWEVDVEQWWHDVTVNLRGPMLCCHHVLKHMVRQNNGIVINMRGGDRIAGGTAYASSKTALQRFSELLARELEIKQTDVLCFSIGPGFVRTEMTELQLTTEQGRFWLPGSQEVVNTGRDRAPEDCARATARLIASADPVINGQAFGPDSDIEKAIAEAKAKRD